MKWSWRIGSVDGIGIYVHFTFTLILLWAGYIAWGEQHNVVHALLGVASICVLFGIVVLHELGHATAAKYYGIRTRDIVLLPIGGVARLERMPEKPVQELVVALAGPAVNALLAGIAFVLIQIIERTVNGSNPGSFNTQLLGDFCEVNVFLGLFNLIPAFPMDGGRVLRALLALKMDYVRATVIAARIGQGLAVLFALFGLATGSMLLLIAVFVFYGAKEEVRAVQMRLAISGLRIGQAMITDFATLAPHDTLATAASRLLGSFQQDFPVVRDGVVSGILYRNDLLAALNEHGGEALVADFMQTDFPTARPEELLQDVLARVLPARNLLIPIVNDGRLLGIVTMENVAKFLHAHGALRTVGERPR